ncbi:MULTISPECIES: phosphoribosylformylglycinamidine synthase I [unclassified Methanoculleus]|uniref:phosphoribosylformylglycinamidine synthase I n=1 Tax=unclassified Methanoculleus TaxID=2619537 RepID=UPI0025F778A4|nr:MULTISPECIES: phosphoribosylformylglycinamidine synthase I [unclassified Methanoculleus]MCK9317579.1 phosphoribosylformylglycinamidine synthase I [Methanoculleus sp.]MDD2254132.1 phosphoribosylformylglycinamidine synthase I [Methanoculleus sp.]MDD2786949.1 phosphoribosylformylglycinamidine synthase I [Methanoculleus sp.]MDD3215855.1 phosphoribosylformylglycinamidine synthase I [Methanoculleus sp.]MDD4314236.1 phosphoribosylformylglycinamidine synthase I [Methanoculleus sp.]
MRFAVVQFGGSNCDRDVYHVLAEVCGVDTDLVWYKDGLARSYDAVVLPGGFSYGDYLRAGAIAARNPIMAEIVRHAKDGGLVLGICNGAQIGSEAGLVDGTFTLNAYPKFISRHVYLRVENTTSPFTALYREGEVIRVPIAHKEGRYVAPEDVIARLNCEGRVAFRFCDEHGNPTPESNPNGSTKNITGVLSEAGNVLAMMPHPERASEAVLGSVDGIKIFKSMMTYIEQHGHRQMTHQEFLQ